MQPNIRPMRSEDRSAVADLLARTSQFTPEEMTVAAELIDSYLSQSVASGYHIMVAETEGQVSGYICYGPSPMTSGTWDIYWIAVDPSRQGQGMGKRLLSFAEGRIGADSGRMVLVETSSKPGYARARRFYDDRGYTIVAMVEDYYSPGDHKLIFRKRVGRQIRPLPWAENAPGRS